MAIIVTPNMMSGSTVYTTTTNVVQQTAQNTNPYLASCSGQSACASYGALTKCGIDIWQGVRACQTIYLVGKDGNLIDTDRLDYVTVTAENVFGCKVYWFDSRGTEDTNPIEFLQSKFDGEMFHINADNFNDIMFGSNSPMFDVDEDSIFLSDGQIKVVSGGCTAPFITVPLEYSEHISVRAGISDETGSLKLTMRANGAPNVIQPNEDNEIVMLTESTDKCMLEFGVSGEGSFTLDDMVFVTNAGISNKGAVRVCFEDYETKYMIPSVLTGTVVFKFKDDDPTEQGSVQVVKCVPIGTVHKNNTLDDSDETPVISELVRPEHIVYDNSESGLESDNMADVTIEMKQKIEGFHNDKHYEADCVAEEDVMYDRWYWRVEHNLGIYLTSRANGELMGMGVKVTTFDTEGNEIYGGIKYIDENRLLVYFAEQVDGKIIIN